MSNGIHFTEDLKVNGAKLVAGKEIPEIEQLPWPSKANGRPVEGGNLDQIVVKSFFSSDLTKDLIVRTDGAVLYRSQNGDQFKIRIKNAAEAIVEYIISPQNGVKIERNTPHSYPFGNDHGFEEISRETNGVTLYKNFETISAKKTEPQKLDRSFVERKLFLEESASNAAYDVVQSTVQPVEVEGEGEAERAAKFTTPNGKTVEAVTLADWPIGQPLERSTVRPLSQQFTMEWVDEGPTKEILFKGVSGHLTGGQGRPGVVFHKETNKIDVNLLMSRPDGSFFISTDAELIMIVAQSDQNGEPIQSTLAAITFKNGAKLAPGWWHSVPFPPPNREKIHLEEKIASTDANVVLNVKEESGSPLVIQL